MKFGTKLWLQNYRLAAPIFLIFLSMAILIGFTVDWSEPYPITYITPKVERDMIFAYIVIFSVQYPDGVKAQVLIPSGSRAYFMNFTPTFSTA